MPNKSNNKSNKGISRRNFMRNLSYSLIGAQVVSCGKGPSSNISDKSKSKKKDKMNYRVLGRTGLKVSEISLGGHYDGIGYREKCSDTQIRSASLNLFTVSGFLIIKALLFNCYIILGKLFLNFLYYF